MSCPDALVVGTMDGRVRCVCVRPEGHDGLYETPWSGPIGAVGVETGQRGEVNVTLTYSNDHIFRWTFETCRCVEYSYLDINGVSVHGHVDRSKCNVHQPPPWEKS